MTFTETDRQRFRQEVNMVRAAMVELCDLIMQLQAHGWPEEPAELRDRIMEAVRDLKKQWDVLRRTRSALQPEPEDLWRQHGDLLEGPVFLARKTFETEVERLLEAAERAL